MPITKTAGVITYTNPSDEKRGQETGVRRSSQHAICADNDPIRQIKFDPSAQTSDTTVTIASGASSADATHTLPAASSTLATTTQAAAETLEYNAPATGATIVVAAATTALVIEPAGTIATLTVTLPDEPADGTIISMSSVEIVTALTIDTAGSDTIVTTATALAAGVGIRLIYRSSSTEWFKI